jgi:hypothetical protein
VQLAEHEDYGLTTTDMYEGRDYSRKSAIRNSLARLKRAGLADNPTYWPHLRGRPNRWQITAAGREALQRAVPDLERLLSERRAARGLADDSRGG